MEIADSSFWWQKEYTQQLRVLLHAEPLLRLLANGPLSRTPGYQHYPLLTLGVYLLNSFIHQTGLEASLDDRQVMKVLEPLLRSLDIEAGIEPEEQRHLHVSRSVLGALRNDEKGQEPFLYEYTDFEHGKPVSHSYPIRLLEWRYRPDGEPVLRLSKEAINLLLHSLTVEIENQQISTEAIIAQQLKKGLFADAEHYTALARLQSIHLCEKFERLLFQVQRDYHRVNWEESFALINDALEHLMSRYKVEDEIIQTAQEQRSHLEIGSKEATYLTKILHLMEACYQSHLDLRDRLNDAYEIFLTEQKRQGFSFVGASPLPALQTDVLEPLLKMPARDVEAIAESGTWLHVPALAPGIFSFTAYLEYLLQPPRTPPIRYRPVKQRNHVIPRERLEQRRFGPESHAAVESFLVAQRGKRMLSALLQDGAEKGLSVAEQELLLLVIMRSFFSREKKHHSIDQVVPEPERYAFPAFAGDDAVIYFQEQKNDEPRLV